MIIEAAVTMRRETRSKPHWTSPRSSRATSIRRVAERTRPRQKSARRRTRGLRAPKVKAITPKMEVPTVKCVIVNFTAKEDMKVKAVWRWHAPVPARAQELLPRRRGGGHTEHRRRGGAMGPSSQGTRGHGGVGPSSTSAHGSGSGSASERGESRLCAW